MTKELLLTGERHIALAEYTETPIAPDEVHARGILSAISHGTELSLYRGTSPFGAKRFDTQLRLFLPAEPGSAYPQRLGYEWVGEVTEVGAQVTGYQPGMRVHLPLPHRETQTFKPAALAQLEVDGPLPEALSPERAVFLSSTSIALQAVHDARLKVGDRVVVFGLGVLGLLAVQLARRNGAALITAVDPAAMRRDLARELGADLTYDPTGTDVGLALKTSAGGADAAIEFSGSYAALQDAIRSVGMGGLVVAAGFYQGEAAALNLGEEWLHNRVTMVASTRSWGNPHRDHPLWHRPRLRAEAIALLSSGELHPEALLTHRLPFAQGAEAYELIHRGLPEVLKVALQY